MENASFTDTRVPESDMLPGAKDSAILLMDSALTLLKLGKAEAAQALATLPQLLLLIVYRLPALLLTWVSFGLLIACSVYALTESLVFAAGSFFLLQLGLTMLLERRAQLLHARMNFPETRKGLAVLQSSLKERFAREDG